MLTIMILTHGTTLRRAQNIIEFGPNPNYVEPGGNYGDTADGFSTYPVGHPTPRGASVTDYAFGKSRHFPNEGGAVILEIDVPIEIVDVSRNDSIGQIYFADTGEIRFEPGMGLEELIHAWPNLTKRIIKL